MLALGEKYTRSEDSYYDGRFLNICFVRLYLYFYILSYCKGNSNESLFEFLF